MSKQNNSSAPQINSVEKHIENYAYLLQDQIGRGNSGTVYKGRNTDTNEVVAIKVIDKQKMNVQDKFYAESLKKEIKIMEKLNSDYIVKMYDVYATPNNIYIIIEYCEFVHRDIKPENCLIKNGVYKVADFGFARKVDIQGRQKMNDFVGSPLYMSPQILDQKEYSAKSDIWSIGMMFYELIFGKSPWTCRDINSLLKAITTTPLRFPYEKPIREVTKDFIRRCLVVEEKDRISWEELFNHSILQNIKLTASQKMNQQNKQSSQQQQQNQQQNQNQQQQQNGYQDQQQQQQDIQIQQMDYESQQMNQFSDFDDRSKKALKKVQEIVQNYNLDILDIFKHFDQDKNGELDEQEFHNFLCKIDPSLNFIATNNVFQKLDKQNKKQITFEIFSALFNEYDFVDLEDQASHLVSELREIIKSYQLNLKDIFKKFDKNQKGTLDFENFSLLIKIIAPALNEEEMNQVFKKFDIDSDGVITFNEFELVLDKQQNDIFTKQKQPEEKVKRLLDQLKYIVKQKQLDIKKIFDNFDMSGDQELQFDEIKKLLMVFDKRIMDEEVDYVINYLDSDKNGSVSFKEFSQAFK